MHVFGDGNVTEFRSVTTKYDAQIRSQPALVPSAERTLYFTDIAERISVPLEQVEWVIMRALSLGLIKGGMDQIDGTVSVTWVVPRVLNQAQLKALANRFGE